MKKDFLKIGQIVNTQGIKGELRVYPLTDYKERFEELRWVYIGDNLNDKFYINSVRYKNNLVILKLRGINDINSAEQYKNQYLVIDKKNARDLPEDTYFIADLIGLEVYTEQDELIGKIKDVIQSGANDLYEITLADNSEKIVLIPAVAEFIKKVDLIKKRITVKLIEGLIE